MQVHVVFGLETNVLFGSEKMIEFSFDGGTLADLSDRLVSISPGAHWRLMPSGSVLIYRDSSATKFASVPIAFVGLDKATLRQTWQRLLVLPELKKFTLQERCETMDILRGHEWEGDLPSITIPSGKRTLDELLDQAVRDSGRFYWSILRNTRGGQCEIYINVW